MEKNILKKKSSQTNIRPASKRFAFGLLAIAFLSLLLLNLLYSSVYMKYDIPIWDNFSPLLILFAIIAFVIASIRAFYKAYSHGGHVRRGILAAALGGVAAFLLTAFSTLPNMGSSGEHSHRSWCKSRLNSIGRALSEYVAGNEGFLPPGDSFKAFILLDESGYLWTKDMVYCPSSHVERPVERAPLRKESVSYVYLGAGRCLQDMKQPVPIFMDMSGNHIGYGNALFSDWSVISFSGDEWKHICKGAEAAQK